MSKHPRHIVPCRLRWTQRRGVVRLMALVAACLTVAALTLPASTLTLPGSQEAQDQTQAQDASDQPQEVSDGSLSEAATTEEQGEAASDAQDGADEKADAQDQEDASDEGGPALAAAPMAAPAAAPAKAPSAKGSGDYQVYGVRIDTSDPSTYGYYDNFYMTGASSTPNPATDTVVYCLNADSPSPSFVDITSSGTITYWEHDLSQKFYSWNDFTVVAAAPILYGRTVGAAALFASANKAGYIRAEQWALFVGKWYTWQTHRPQPNAKNAEELEKIEKFILYNGYPWNAAGLLGTTFPNTTEGQNKLRRVTQRVVQYYSSGTELETSSSEANKGKPSLSGDELDAAKKLQGAVEAYRASEASLEAYNKSNGTDYRVPPAGSQLYLLQTTATTTMKMDIGTAQGVYQDFIYLEVPAEVSISKVAKDAQGVTSPLAGAQLSIHKSDASGTLGDTVASITTTTDVFKVNLAEGYYVLHEDAAPEGYLPAADILFHVDADGTVTVDGKQVDTVTMEDQHRPEENTYDLSVRKTGTSGGITVNSQLAGASLAVYQTDESGNQGSQVATFTTTDSPQGFKLPAGYYALRELSAPAGYQKAADVRFRVTDTGSVEVLSADGTWVATGDTTVTMADEATTTTCVKVTKKWDADDTTHPSSVKVHLERDGQVVEGSEVTLDESNGWSHTWTDLPEGSYQVVEDVPDGYTASYAMANGTVKTPATTSAGWVNALEGEGIKDGQYYVIVTNGQGIMANGAWNSVKAVTVDPSQPSAIDSLQWKAVASGSGFKFQNKGTRYYLYYMSPLGMGGSASASTTFTVDAAGHLLMSGIGYVAAPSSNGTFSSVSSASAAASFGFYSYSTGGNCTPTEVPCQEWTITNTRGTSASLTLRKVGSFDASKVLSGAEFDLRDTEGSTVAHLFTGDDGTATADGLKPGTYYLVETKAPDGYELIPTPIQVQVEVGSVKVVDADLYACAYGTTVTVNDTLKEYELPKTGGMGTYLPRVVGLLMGLSALVVAARRGRRRGEGHST